MSDVESSPGDNEGDGTERRRRGGIFDRWGVWPTLLVAVVLLAGVGGGAWLVGSRSAAPQEVLVEAADTVGRDPFTTAGITLVASSSDGTASPGLFGGSGDNGVCAPKQLVEFLESQPAKAAAWVAALNSDRTLEWSGGSSVAVGQIPAYVDELTPAFLKNDTRVTNHGFKDGEATPRQSLLKKGTAVLVDKAGVPRVRCFCGNPLLPPSGSSADPSVAVDEPTPDPTPTATVATTPSPTPSPTSSNGCIPDLPETDGCGPEPGCEPIPPVSAGFTNQTIAPGDFTGDGTADDYLLVYQLGSVWHVRVEVGGVGVDDDVLVGPGPMMTAIGGATVNNDTVHEAWVKVGSGSSTDIVGVLTMLDCDLQRLTIGGSPAEFPVGSTTTAADGVACFGFDAGIQVFSTTSTDGVTYTGTSTIYTIDVTTVPHSLVAGATASETETTSDPGWQSLHTFQCDSLSAIP